MTDFIKEDILKKFAAEFPDLSKLKKDSVVQFQNNKEVRFAGIGMKNYGKTLGAGDYEDCCRRNEVCGTFKCGI